MNIYKNDEKNNKNQGLLSATISSQNILNIKSQTNGPLKTKLHQKEKKYL